MEDRVSVENGFQRVRSDKKIPDLLVIARDLIEPSLRFGEVSEDGAIVSARRKQQAIGLRVLGDELIQRNLGQSSGLFRILIGRLDILVIKVAVPGYLINA